MAAGKRSIYWCPKCEKKKVYCLNVKYYGKTEWLCEACGDMRIGYKKDVIGETK